VQALLEVGLAGWTTQHLTLPDERVLFIETAIGRTLSKRPRTPTTFGGAHRSSPLMVEPATQLSPYPGRCNSQPQSQSAWQL